MLTPEPSHRRRLHHHFSARSSCHLHAVHIPLTESLANEGRGPLCRRIPSRVGLVHSIIDIVAMDGEGRAILDPCTKAAFPILAANITGLQDTCRPE